MIKTILTIVIIIGICFMSYYTITTSPEDSAETKRKNHYKIIAIIIITAFICVLISLFGITLK